MDHLDSQAIKKALNLKNSAVVFQRWVLYESKQKIFVISTNRIHLLGKKPPHKPDFSAHLLEVQAIESSSLNIVKITVASGKGLKLELKFDDDEDAVLSISHTIALLWLNFPALDAGGLCNVIVSPEERSAMLVTFNDAFKESQTDVGPCNGFSTTYFSICNYFSQPSLEEVAWDIDKIYAAHDCTVFDTADFEHLEMKELLPLIAAIGYNDWFKTFRCTSVKLGSEVVEVICKTLRFSLSLETIVLKSVSFSKDQIQKLTTAIASNPNGKIKSIDLSGNNVEDRGLTHLCGLISSLPHGIEELVLNNIGLSSKASGALGTIFRSTKLISSTLVRLSLANNSLKVDGATVISELLSKPNNVKELDLSNTECAIDLIFGALLRGCLMKLETLKMSGNPFSYKRKNTSQLLPSLQQFFGSAIAISDVDLSNSKLPAEVPKAILLGLIGNNAVTSISLNFSKNELKGPGGSEIGNCLPGLKNLTSLNVSDNAFDMELIPFCENVAKNTSLQRLDISQNVAKMKSANIANLVESLVEMCLSESLPLQYLSVADNKLKQDTSMLFDALGANNSLQEMDISGNSMGDGGARLLAKALQINTKLKILHLDRNGVTHKGYKDIAAGLKRNFSMQYIPTPVIDMAQGLKHYGEQLQKHIHKIEKLLHRNMSMEKVDRDHFFRLQQNVILGFLNQQRIDEMVVNLEDTIISAKENSDEEIVTQVENSKAVVRDAEKLKDVVHGICVDAINIDKTVEVRMDTLSDDLLVFANDLLKKNIVDMLEMVMNQCPVIFLNQTEVNALQKKLTDNCKIEFGPVKETVGKSLYGQMLQKIKEASMTVASSIAEELTVIVYDRLSSSAKKLQQSIKKKATKETKAQEGVGKKIKKNRLSLLGADTNPATGSSAANLKRRPTFHRNRRDTMENMSEVEIAIDIDDSSSPKPSDGHLSPKPRERIPTATLDFVKGKEELSSLLKDRVKPAKGRRPPTRISQLAQLAPNELADDMDGRDSPTTVEQCDSDLEEKRPDASAIPSSESPLSKPEQAIPSGLMAELNKSLSNGRKNDQETHKEIDDQENDTGKDTKQEEKESSGAKERPKSPSPEPQHKERKPIPKPRISRHKDDLLLKPRVVDNLPPEVIPRSVTAPSKDLLEKRIAAAGLTNSENKRSSPSKSEGSEPEPERPELEKPTPADRSPKPMLKQRVGMPMIPQNVMNEIKQRQHRQKTGQESPEMPHQKGDSPKPAIRKRASQMKEDSVNSTEIDATGNKGEEKEEIEAKDESNKQA